MYRIVLLAAALLTPPLAALADDNNVVPRSSDRRIPISPSSFAMRMRCG